MKTLKAICAAAVLALSLSIPAYADTAPGDGHTPGSACPITGGIGTSDPTPGEPSIATTDAGDISFSVLADLMWAMASIF